MYIDAVRVLGGRYSAKLTQSDVCFDYIFYNHKYVKVVTTINIMITHGWGKSLDLITCSYQLGVDETRACDHYVVNEDY